MKFRAYVRNILTYFSDLGVLDRFMIENGTVNSFGYGLLTGLTIVRNTSASPSFPKHHGALIIKNTKLATGSLPTDLLTGQTELYQVVFRVCLLRNHMNFVSVETRSV